MKTTFQQLISAIQTYADSLLFKIVVDTKNKEVIIENDIEKCYEYYSVLIDGTIRRVIHYSDTDVIITDFDNILDLKTNTLI